jgi:broad specificity phosphatase PhoE
LAGSLAPRAALAERAILILRHAERVDESPDAELSPAGHARAKALVDKLRDAGVARIFTSERKRTIETAAPLAAALKITPVVVQHDDTKGLVAQLHARDDIPLVVGHGDTLPGLLTALGWTGAFHIEKTDYDNLWLFVPKAPGGPLLIRLHL